VAWLTLGETFTWLKIIGAAVTMGGIAWAQFGGGKPAVQGSRPARRGVVRFT
jgi:drug/metabolite transporter (DMT)-like permease